MDTSLKNVLKARVFRVLLIENQIFDSSTRRKIENGTRFAIRIDRLRAPVTHISGCLMRILGRLVIIIQKIIHRVLQWPSKTTHLVYSIGPIRRRTVNRRINDITFHSRNLSTLTAEDSSLACDLKGQGYCTTDIRLFRSFESEKFQAASREIYALMERNHRETGENTNIINLLSAEPSLIDQFETIFRAGLDIKLLKIIEHYLQMPVAFGGVDIFFTVADGLERGARTWHKDSEDSPMVKVAVYLNDVGDDDGPLEILHLHAVSPEFKKLRGFRQDKLVASRDEGKVRFDITSFTGPVGTMILCDTSKYYHRGKPATGKNRKALFFNYYASRPLTPYFCPNPPFSFDKMKDLVSDLTETQRDSALWREKLTRVDKIVTKRKPYLEI